MVNSDFISMFNDIDFIKFEENLKNPDLSDNIWFKGFDKYFYSAQKNLFTEYELNIKNMNYKVVKLPDCMGIHAFHK